MQCFSKVLTTFCKEIHEMINTIVIKECYKYEDEEIQHQKKANVLFHPHFLKCFFFIINIIITERFNIHCSRIMRYVVMQSFLFGCRPNFINVLLVYFSTVTLFHNIQNIFQMLDTKGAMKIDFNLFQFGKHSFQFSARN